MMIRTAASLLISLAMCTAPVFAFAPVTAPQNTNASPECLVCAFVTDQLQKRLPFETLEWARSKESAVRSAAKVAELATLVDRIADALERDRWVYHVDQHRVLQAPEDQQLRNAPPAPASLDSELAAHIIARGARRRAMGLRSKASPWLTTTLREFNTKQLKPKTAHYHTPDARENHVGGPGNLTAVQLEAMGISAADVHIATQSNEDQAHDADFMRAIAVFVDTAHLDRRAPPEHFLARLLCVMELHVCTGADDVQALEAIDVSWHDQRVTAERNWAAVKTQGTPRAPRTNADDKFTPAFMVRLNEAVRGWNDEQPKATPSQIDDGDL